MEEKLLNQRKQRIVNAAIEVIKEKNLEKATVREIAAKAGLTTGAIYYHYKNKEELFQDIINDTMHLVYGILQGKGQKSQDELLKDVTDAVAVRISSLDEQKLHLLILNNIIAKNGENLEKCKETYKTVIEQTGNMYYHTFGVENDKYKHALGAILVAALDGIAILQTLGALPEETDRMAEIFNNFFVESIPAFLEKHK